MSDPLIISLLTEDYKRFIAAGEETLSRLHDDDDEANVPHDGVDNLKLIMDADALFKQMEPQLDSSDFYLLMVDGQQGSGKSTLARELTHHAHMAGYKPLYSSGFDITEAPEKFGRAVAGHDKVCVILDDLSYILSSTSAKTQNKIKSFFALIRHFLTQENGGRPVRVMVIVIAHFTTAVPPIFKNSNVWIFSKPTTLEYDNMVKIIGRNQKAREELEDVFNSVVDIQEKANKTRDLILTVQGEEYRFRWGARDDPGDGRLVMLLLNRKPVLYNSRSVFCKICEHIGFGVNIQAQDYQTARPGDENTAEDRKKGLGGDKN